MGSINRHPNGLRHLVRRPRLLLSIAAAFALLVLVAACGSSGGGGDTTADEGSGSTESTTASKDKYSIYLTTNFTGNAFREQMVRTAEYAAANEPLKSRIEKLEVVTSQESVQAQSQAIDNIIREKPDVIMLQAASEDGVNAAIQRACDAGITVVSVDSTATAPCNYQYSFDREEATENLGNMLIDSLEDASGSFLVDAAIPGQSVSEESKQGYLNAVDQASGLKAVEFQGELNPGVTKSAVANVLPANRDVKGIGLIAFSPQVEEAVSEAGLEPVAVGSIAAFNEDALLCVEEAFPCFYAASPPAFFAEAMQWVIELLDGDADPEEKYREAEIEYFSNAATSVPGKPDIEVKDFETGVTAFPDLPPTLALPLGPEWLDITAEEAAGQ